MDCLGRQGRSAVLRWLAGLVTSRLSLFLTAGLGLCLTGCATTWDDLTSRRFREAPFKTVMGQEDPPLQVMREQRTGDERVRAMRKLQEPMRSSGTQAEQEEVMTLLTKTAISDPHALCRLTAIETLARFEDPRASESLMMAYRAVEPATPAKKSDGVQQTTAFDPAPALPGGFSADLVVMIQTRSLVALGKKKSANALPLLAEIASQPNRNDNTDTELIMQTGLTGQNRQDVRVAAVRALGQYPADQRAAQALYKVVKQEQDVALRTPAHEGLIRVTGRELPPDSQEWEVILASGQLTPRDPNLVEQVGNLFNR